MPIKSNSFNLLILCWYIVSVSLIIVPVNADRDDIVGMWMLDRQEGKSDDIITFNFNADGSFTDTHHFADGRTQNYDWGSWEYLGNNRYVVHEVTNTVDMSCDGSVLRNNLGTSSEEPWHRITVVTFAQPVTVRTTTVTVTTTRTVVTTQKSENTMSLKLCIREKKGSFGVTDVSVYLDGVYTGKTDNSGYITIP